MLAFMNRARTKRANGEDGFTLIELLVVVVILGILIAIAIPVYLNYRKSANDKAAQSDLRGGISTLEICNSNNSSYPLTVNATTGVTETACGQTVSLSTGTTLRYVTPSGATTGNVASYTMYSTNSGGTTGKIYCYNSATGSGVIAATGTAMATATC